MRPLTHLNQLFTNISLSKSQKTEIEKLITEYNSLRKTYQEQIRSATTNEAKEKLKTERDSQKTIFKDKLLALIPANQKDQVEALFSKSKQDWEKKKKDWLGKGKSKNFRWNALGFLRSFLDENQLSETQKSEIQTLQQAKADKMRTLLSQIKDATTEEQKTELEKELQTINQEFLNTLKKYISTEKIEEYEAFINEMQTWTQKSKKWKNKSSSSSLNTTTGNAISKKVKTTTAQS